MYHSYPCDDDFEGLTFQPYALVASINELYLFFLSIICEGAFNDLYGQVRCG